MTRLGMQKVPSLLFDIELEEAAESGCELEPDIPVVKEQLRDLLQFGDTVHKQMYMEAQRATARHGNTCVWDLATALAENGWSVRVRYTVPNPASRGGGSDCLKNLRHNFIVCEAGEERYVVDPQFKEQFMMATPTPRYGAVLDELREVLVAREADVGDLVGFMTREMGLAFQQSGGVVPPWRKAAAMMSKWHPRAFEDYKVPPRGAPRHTGSGKGASLAGKGRLTEEEEEGCGGGSPQRGLLEDTARGRTWMGPWSCQLPDRGLRQQGKAAQHEAADRCFPAVASPASQGQLSLQLRQMQSPGSAQSWEMLCQACSADAPVIGSGGKLLLRHATPRWFDELPVVHRVMPGQ